MATIPTSRHGRPPVLRPCARLAPLLIAIAASLPSAESRADFRISTLPSIQAGPAVAVGGERLVAAWHGGGGAGALGWGFSVDRGATWTNGFGLPTAATLGLHDPSAIAVSGAEDVYLFSYNGYGYVLPGQLGASGPAWGAPRLAVPYIGFYSAIDVPSLATTPDGNAVYLAFSRPRVNFTFTSYAEYIEFTRSTDRGVTWTTPVILSGPQCNGPRAAVGPDGELYVVWEDFAAQRMVGRRSLDNGASFGPEFVVGEVFDNLGMAPAGWKNETSRFNPRYPPGRAFGPSWPSVAVDHTNGPNRGRLYVAWAERAAGTVQQPGLVVYQDEPNETFATATPVHLGEDVYGVLTSIKEGPPDCDYLVFDGTAGTTLWVNAATAGITPDPPPDLIQFHWELYCERAPGDYYLLAYPPMQEPEHGPVPPLCYTLPRDGRYYLFMSCGQFYDYGYWLQIRAFHANPGQAARDHRDIVLVASADGGATWTPKVRVNDDPPWFDNAMPAIAVDGRGVLHAAWYDRRDDTGCGDHVNVYWSASLDGGQTFVPNRRLSSVASVWDNVDVNDGRLGDQVAIAAGDDYAAVLWTDFRNEDLDVYGEIVSDLPTPVTVTQLVAEPGPEGVRLRWQATDISQVAGFVVERRQNGASSFERIGNVVPAHSGSDYEATDTGAQPGASYTYRIGALSGSGEPRWLAQASVTLPLADVDRLQLAASPNPTSSELMLTLELPRPATGTLEIVDLAGRLVRTVHAGALPAGRSSLRWDARDRAGARVQPGLFLARAEIAGERCVRKVVIAR